MTRIEELAEQEKALVSSNNNGSNDHVLYRLRKELDLLRIRARKSMKKVK